MNVAKWKRLIWPDLSAEVKDAIRAEVKRLKDEGWSEYDAWVQAASTYA